MATEYVYLVTDFPNHKVASNRLSVEIQASPIITALDYIGTDEINCDIWFKDTLSLGDKSILDSIVAAHSGESLPAPVDTVHLDTPETSDGKPIFLPCAFPGDVLLYQTGQGDDLTTGVRGNGEYLKFSSSTIEEPCKEIRFRDYIYLIGGWVQYVGGDIDDGVDFQVNAPATVVTSTPGTGNVNVSSYKIVPAPGGDGAYTLNMTEKHGDHVTFLKLVPIPSRTTTGWWNYDDENHVLTTAPEQDGDYDLYTIPLTIARQVKEIPILGSGQTDLTFLNIKAKKMLPQWILKIILHNRNGGTIKVRAFLTTGRKTTT